MLLRTCSEPPRFDCSQTPPRLIPLSGAGQLITWVEAFVEKPISGGVANAILGRMDSAKPSKGSNKDVALTGAAEDDQESEANDIPDKLDSEHKLEQGSKNNELEVVVSTDEGNL